MATLYAWLLAAVAALGVFVVFTALETCGPTWSSTCRAGRWPAGIVGVVLVFVRALCLPLAYRWDVFRAHHARSQQRGP